MTTDKNKGTCTYYNNIYCTVVTVCIYKEHQMSHKGNKQSQST